MKNKYLLLALSLFLSLLHVNIYVIFLCCIFYIVKKEKKLFIYYLCFLVIPITILHLKNFIYLPYGVVSKKTDTYIVVSNYINNVILYGEYDVQYDDIVYYEGIITKKQNRFNTYGFKQETYFKQNNIKDSYLHANVKVVFRGYSIRNFLYQSIQKIHDRQYKSIFLKVFLNHYDDELPYLLLISGFYFSSFFHVLFQWLRLFFSKRISNHILFFVHILCFIIFGIQFHLIRLFFNRMIKRLTISKLDYLGIKIMFVCLFFPYKLTSLSFILPTVYSMLFVFKRYRNYTYMTTLLLHLLYFNTANLFFVFFNKYLYKLYAYLFVLTILAFVSKQYLLLKVYRIFDILHHDWWVMLGSISFTSLFIVMYCLVKRWNEKWIILLLYVLYFLNLNHLYTKVTFINVGQGDSILIQSLHGNVLIDTGNPYNYKYLYQYLVGSGIKTIDYFVITHNDSDHNGNLLQVVSDFKVKNIIYDHQNFNVGKISFLSLNEPRENDNDSSLLYYASISDVRFLFTGDISSKIEQKIIKQYDLKVDVLKLAHHGSNTSSSIDFLNETRASINIVSSGYQYRHPHKEVVRRLMKSHLFYLDTKESGDIEIYMTWLGNVLITSKQEIVFF